MQKTLALLPVLAAAANGMETTLTLRDGVVMPRVNLGTCCGSTPDAGLTSWVQAGGVGIDTAWDYKDQDDIARILADQKVKREDVFILSKVPAGFGNATDCNPDPQVKVTPLLIAFTCDSIRCPFVPEQ